MNNKNLMTPQEINSRLTPEQRKEKARMMGIASGEARRQRKLARDIMTDFLNAPITSGDVLDTDTIRSMKDINGKNMTVLAQGLARLALRVATKENNNEDLKLALQIAGEWVERAEQTVDMNVVQDSKDRLDELAALIE